MDAKSSSNIVELTNVKLRTTILKSLDRAIQKRTATYFARALEARAFFYSYITILFVATVHINDSV